MAGQGGRAKCPPRSVRLDCPRRGPASSGLSPAWPPWRPSQPYRPGRPWRRGRSSAVARPAGASPPLRSAYPPPSRPTRCVPLARTLREARTGMLGVGRREPRGVRCPLTACSDARAAGHGEAAIPVPGRLAGLRPSPLQRARRADRARACLSDQLVLADQVVKSTGPQRADHRPNRVGRVDQRRALGVARVPHRDRGGVEAGKFHAGPLRATLALSAKPRLRAARQRSRCKCPASFSSPDALTWSVDQHLLLRPSALVSGRANRG